VRRDQHFMSLPASFIIITLSLSLSLFLGADEGVNIYSLPATHKKCLFLSPAVDRKMQNTAAIDAASDFYNRDLQKLLP